MRPVFAALPLLVLVLAGCAPSVPPSSPPAPPGLSLAEELRTAPAVSPPPPGSDERFLALLGARGVPYAGRNPRADASIVCATFAADPDVTRDQVAALTEFAQLQHQRWWVDTSVEVYCPQFAQR